MIDDFLKTPDENNYSRIENCLTETKNALEMGANHALLKQNLVDYKKKHRPSQVKRDCCYGFMTGMLISSGIYYSSGISSFTFFSRLTATISVPVAALAGGISKATSDFNHANNEKYFSINYTIKLLDQLILKAKHPELTYLSSSLSRRSGV